ncbi:MAG: tetratricopeptide repeat protein [Bacteroidales bacterium]|nr:tetratricopeptide repeat protein [Bacteroidales bacterium]
MRTIPFTVKKESSPDFNCSSFCKVKYLLSFLLVTLLVLPKLNAQESREIDSLQEVLSKKLVPEKRIASLYALGKAYFNASDYRKALETDRKLIEVISKSGTLADSAKAFRHIGLVMLEMSWYDESLNYFMKAQALYGALGDSAKQATSLMNVGIVHDCLGNTPMSLTYYNKALDYFTQIRDESGIANCKLNIGILLTKQKQFEKASEHFIEASEIYKKTNNMAYVGASYINLALALKNQKKFDLALDYLDKSFEIFTNLNDKLHIGYYHVNIGELLLQLNRLDEAKPHLDKARELAEDMEVMELKVRSYEFLSDYYLKRKDFKGAYEMLLKSKTFNDSTLNAEMVKKVSQIQYHYEIAKREAENVQLVKQNLQKELKLTQRTTMVYILIALLLLIAVVVVILLLWNRSKHKANLQLEAKNRLINAQKEELIKLNASKDKFLSLLAHDIKNPLSAILGISDILRTDYAELKEEERMGFINDIHSSSSNLFEIVTTLLNWAISQNGMISHQPKEFDLNTLCHNSVNRLQPIAKLKDISLYHESNLEHSAFADDNMIMSVVQNLLTNAIKYSYRGGKITVKTAESEGMVEVAVIDEGTGISEENQSKLFRYDMLYRSKGTTGESGTGIGLILCKEFIERNNGKIWVESEINKGSSFKFTLPASSN